jgi:hypothetical protein
LLLPKWGRGDGSSFEREWDVAFGQLKSESAVAHDTFILHFGVRACRVSCYQAAIGPLGGGRPNRAGPPHAPTTNNVLRCCYYSIFVFQMNACEKGQSDSQSPDLDKVARRHQQFIDQEFGQLAASDTAILGPILVRQLEDAIAKTLSSTTLPQQNIARGTACLVDSILAITAY